MTFTELFAAGCGLMGTLLLACNGRFAGFGFVAFLGSNAGWLAFAYGHQHWAMLVQQIGFTVSSLIGIYVWIIRPAFDRAFCRAERELGIW